MRKKIVSLALILFMALSLMPANVVFAEEQAPSDPTTEITATVTGEIKGTVGTRLEGKIIITLSPKGTFSNNVSGIEIKNIPNKLEQKIEVNNSTGDDNLSYVTISVTGVPEQPNKNKVEITIPKGSVEGGELSSTINGEVSYDINEPPKPVTATATIGNATVRGTVGSAISSTDVTITLSDDGFIAMAARTPVTGWFENMPNNLTAVIKSAISAGANTATVTISGTPRSGSTSQIRITIPGSSLQSGKPITATQSSNAVYSITDTRPVYTATLSGTGSYAYGGGQFREGETVSIYAGTRAGYTFNGWMASRAVTFNNYRDASTWFTMPAGNVTIYANWRANGTTTTTTAATISSPGQANLVTVPTGLVNTRFNTVEAIERELESRVATSLAGYTRSNMIFLNVTPPAGVSVEPNTYVTVTLSYPAGTGAATHDFAISHMLTSAFLNMNPGYVEVISGSRITHTAAGMRVRLQGLSPVAIAYKPKADADPTVTNGVYRAYNSANGDHVLTRSRGEYDLLRARGWTGEKCKFLAASDYTGVGLYSLFNPNTGEHLYTTDTAEVNALSTVYGWKNEGIKFYVLKGDLTDTTGTIGVYRLYNGVNHIFSADPNECKALTEKHGYVYESRTGDPAFRVLPYNG